ncbi:type II secretion system F family protein [Marinobacter orientalis]|uniref:Type II secretion system F family protein n=1 Tax=Marinobacter orientalis TaxID=1928859 RepID=A0A7Y0WRN9_9GAMM|nr:type II secretion system F family protein [Marinobacter orientalis]NMT63101.1 type II secretion system F family protein [Marinobacter orientalis]TGX51760.1 type II secretion system F family protein [Marinobacter orientalis]
MDYLIGMLNSIIEDQQMSQLAFVVLMAVAVFCLALAGMFLMTTLFHPVRSRLHNVVAPEASGTSSGGSFAPLVKSLSPYVLPKKEKELNRTGQRLVHAGFRSDNALSNFYAIKTLLIIGLPLAVFFGLNWVPGLSSLEILQAATAATLVGALGPNYVLGKLIERRKRKLYNGFPDALDLLVVCTEAGYGLKPAIQRVADELVVGHPELSEELALVNSEMRAGVDRIDALKNLSERTGLEEIGGLVALLSQSLRFGTSTAESLRIYSEEFRDKRMQRAEEAAATISTKMIFPLVFCMFPAFFVVAIGPAVVGVLDHFKG